MTLDLDRTRIERAKVAVGITFATNGIAYAGWLARAPAARADLDLSTAGFGLLLLFLSGAAIAAIPVAGPLVQRVGPARAVSFGATGVILGLVLLATGTALGSVALAAAGLFLAGAGNSTWDVAMNVEGADVERRLGRTIMPRLHACFSLGTVVGAGVSAGFAALGVSLAVQLWVTSALATAVMIAVAPRFLPHPPVAAGDRAPMSVLDAWRTPRILLIGLVMLGFGFTEGTANDWLAIGLVDGYRASEAVGAIGFGVFVTAMTLGRLSGGWAIERWGRVTVLRLTGASAAAGLLLVVADLSVPLAMLGALLWGAGASLGFPIGMSSAADDPLRAAINVSVAGSIGYGAFLAGPPLVGFLAEHFGVLNALFCVLAAITLGVAASHATRPLAAAPPSGG